MEVNRAEVNDLLGTFGNLTELAAGLGPLPPHWCDDTCGRCSRNLFYGTKLEQRQKECYMWITGDRQARGSGKRIGSVQGGPGKSQGNLKTVPALEPMAERPARPVILPVNFESGERRWREA